MKPRQSDVKVQRMDDEEIVIQMEIDEEGLPALIGMLTGIYNDPALAVVREYTTNAIDANIESGTKNMVEVYLPSEIGEPEFVVKDYGPGMDPADVRDTYSKYVRSTKRNTNDVAGMFGIGSKSALAYTGQFTVRSVKDGIATVMTFTRTDGAPEIGYKTYKTEDPNGTTVKVPVKNQNEFNYKAREHFKLLNPGIVLVDGEDLGGRYREHDLGKGVYVLEGQKKHYVLMGNVPYPLPDDIGFAVDNRYNRRNTRQTRGTFMFDVPLGTFQPAPPREGLELTDDDIKKLKKMLSDADDAYIDYLSEDFKKATTVMEAVKALNELNNKLQYRTALTRKIDGIEIGSYSFYVPGAIWNHNRVDYNGKNKWDKASMDNNSFIRGSFTFLYNAEPGISDYYHRKTKDFLADKGLPVKYFGVKSKSDIPSGYHPDKIVDFEEVKNWSRPRAGSGATRSKTKWEQVDEVPGGENWRKSRTPFNWRTTSKIDPDSHGNRALVYVSPSDYDRGVTRPMIRMAVKDPDVVLISLAKNRWKKFNKEYKDAKWIKDWYEKARKEKIKGLSEDHFRTRAHLIPSLDTDLHRRYNERAKKINNLRKEAENKVGADQMRLLSTGDDPELTRLLKEIEERYPYAPTSRYYGVDLDKAQVYVEAMDLYYKEKKNAEA